jgi:hypothetical protein
MFCAGCSNRNAGSLVGQNQGQISLYGSIKTQEQCVADGKVFVKNNWVDIDKQNASSWTYDSPEYYLNKKMRTCLVYVSETSPVNSNAYIYRNSYVYDIYGIQKEPILQSSTLRSCPPGGQCTEVLNNDYIKIQNYDTNDFNIKKEALFKE